MLITTLVFLFYRRYSGFSGEVHFHLSQINIHDLSMELLEASLSSLGHTLVENPGPELKISALESSALLNLRVPLQKHVSVQERRERYIQRLARSTNPTKECTSFNSLEIIAYKKQPLSIKPPGPASPKSALRQPNNSIKRRSVTFQVPDIVLQDESGEDCYDYVGNQCSIPNHIPFSGG